MDREFWENKKKIEGDRERKNQDYNANSNNRLCNIVAKNFETAIIGALAEFEDSFGYIWGIDKSKNELTADEAEALEIWQDVRKAILDKGNGKKRASLKEIQNHDVKWKRYNYKFKFKD